MPSISLIITAYNRADYIGPAIRSVLAQTRGDFELVVRDDGSTDDTLEAARQAAGADPRVRVMAGENLGPPASLNAAAKLVSAPYLGWIDSDDLLAENALKETAAVLDARPDIGVVYTSYLVIDANGTVKGPGTRCKLPYSPDRLLVDFMTFHFRLIRRDAFDRAGGIDEAARYAEDYDLCLRLSEITQFHHLDRPLYHYRVHPTAISQSRKLDQINASAEAIRRAIKRRGLDDNFELEIEHSAKFYLRKKN